MSAAKRILLVATSNAALGDTGKETGWYLPEVAHPYKVFSDASCDITFASPKGGPAPVDPGSVTASAEDAVSTDFLASNAAKALTETSVGLADIDPAAFDAVFFAGGFGVMWDFPDDANVQRIASSIYEAGGVVSAVCHGPVALVNVKTSDGAYLVAGKQVTAFTNDEEDKVEMRQVVPYTCQDKLSERGATFKDGGVFAENVVVDGRVITGQNPPSATATAKAVLATLSS